MNDHVLSASPTLDHQTRAALKLWAAVMADGLKRAAEGFKAHDMQHEAVVWLYEDGDSTVKVGKKFIKVRDMPGSFVWICDLMGFDADQARSKALANFRMLARKGAKDVPVES